MIKNCLFIWHPIKVSINWEWLYNIFPNLILSSAFLCCLGRNQMAKHDLKAYLSADDKNTPFERPNGNIYSKNDGFLRKPFNLLIIEGGGEKKVSGSFSCFENFVSIHRTDCRKNLVIQLLSSREQSKEVWNEPQPWSSNGSH